MDKQIKIALVGQPNVGKSSLINAISNSRLKVGNFSGVTVEKKEVEFKYKGIQFIVTDLPGTYSIDGFTMEEKLVKEYLLEENFDIILNVADSTNLDRNLFLTRELMRLHRKMVLALNMSDEAEKEGIKIDVPYLSELLGFQAVLVSASKKEGIELLLDNIIYSYNNQYKRPKVLFSDVIENEIAIIQNYIEASNSCDCDRYEPRDIAIGLLREDKAIYKILHEKPLVYEIQPILHESLNRIYTYFGTNNRAEIFLDEIHSFAHGLYHETVSREPIKTRGLSHKIDDILIHKIWGIPIFLFLMWGLFQLTFELGAVPMDYIDMFFIWMSETASMFIAPSLIHDLVVDGIIPGVGAVIMFLPNIVILFLGIALLESTGYMARVSFLLDGFFHKFGLHGKSFIPLVTGFGCSVPAYMATRTLKSEKDRLITLFIIGFMSCGAKLPVYVLFVGAFFDDSIAGNVLFGIYMFGALLGIGMAKVLRLTVFKSQDEPFVMEMPKYRMPSLRMIWFAVYTKALMYLKKAGTFIMMATILIWFASNFPKMEEEKFESHNLYLQAQLENSYLGQIGKFSEPFFAPLGFDWKLSVALETGLAAKEVVVATLGVLFSVGDEVDENDVTLRELLKNNIPFEVGVSFIIFVIIYMPCFAASLVFARESGGYRYMAYLFIFTTITAWSFSFLGYNITKLFL